MSHFVKKKKDEEEKKEEEKEMKEVNVPLSLVIWLHGNSPRFYKRFQTWYLMEAVGLQRSLL